MNKIKQYINKFSLSDMGACSRCLLDGNRFKEHMTEFHHVGWFSPCGERLYFLIKQSGFLNSKKEELIKELKNLDKDWDCEEIGYWLTDNDFFTWFDNKKIMEIE